MPQLGFFDLDGRYAKLNERDPLDPLIKLNQIIDWEAFREPLSVFAALIRHPLACLSRSHPISAFPAQRGMPLPLLIQ